jgi:hypothetical protein
LAAVLEPFLKALFIWGSETLRDNLPMFLSSFTGPGAVGRPSRGLGRVLGVALALLLGWASLWSPLAQAGGKDDHERARLAVQSGQVLPLPQVLERLAKEHPGQVLEVELEPDDGRWVYEIKLLQTGGRLIKLKLDAQTAEVLRVRSRGGHGGGGPTESKR